MTRQQLFKLCHGTIRFLRKNGGVVVTPYFYARMTPEKVVRFGINGDYGEMALLDPFWDSVVFFGCVMKSQFNIDIWE